MSFVNKSLNYGSGFSKNDHKRVLTLATKWTYSLRKSGYEIEVLIIFRRIKNEWNRLLTREVIRMIEKVSKSVTTQCSYNDYNLSGKFDIR